MHLEPKLQALFGKKLDLTLVYPPFLQRLCQLKLLLLDQGRVFHSYFLFRTMGQSHNLRMKYLAGMGPRAAPAGYSSHNYGLGSDEVLDGDNFTPGLQPDWSVDEDYIAFAKAAEEVGLHCGAAYNDYGHVSWPGWEGQRLGELLKVWNASKAVGTLPRLKEVWAYVDGHP